MATARDELTVLRAAWQLVTPVPRRERGAARISYGSSERLLRWALLGCGLVEIAVVDYLLRNTPLRWPVAVLGLLSIPYFLGLVGMTKAYPHLLYDDRLRLRCGPSHAVDVPLASVRSATTRTTINQRNGVRLDEDGTLWMVRGEQSDLRLDLLAPLLTPHGPVTRIEVSVDDARHPALAAVLS